MEQKKLSRPNKFGELFLFQISYVLPGEYGGWHLLEAYPRHVSVHASDSGWGLVSIHALMRVRLLGGYGTDYQQCNGRFAPISHGRYKDSRP